MSGNLPPAPENRAPVGRRPADAAATGHAEAEVVARAAVAGIRDEVRAALGRCHIAEGDFDIGVGNGCFGSRGRGMGRDGEGAREEPSRDEKVHFELHVGSKECRRLTAVNGCWLSTLGE